MIWTILLSIAGFAIITVLLIYIMPFGIYAAYSYSGNKLTAAAFLLHLSICRVDYDVTDNSMRTRIFGFVLRGPKKDGGSSHDTSDKIKEAADSQSERNESDRPDEDSGSAPLNFEHGSFKDRENSSGFGNRAADSRSQSEKKNSIR